MILVFPVAFQPLYWYWVEYLYMLWWDGTKYLSLEKLIVYGDLWTCGGKLNDIDGLYGGFGYGRRDEEGEDRFFLESYYLLSTTKWKLMSWYVMEKQMIFLSWSDDSSFFFFIMSFSLWNNNRWINTVDWGWDVVMYYVCRLFCIRGWG